MDFSRPAMITMPLLVLGILLRDGSAAAQFKRKGHISSTTAVRSSRIGIERRFILEKDIARGTLVELSGERFYANVDAINRRMRRRYIVLGIAAAACVAVALYLTR